MCSSMTLSCIFMIQYASATLNVHIYRLKHFDVNLVDFGIYENIHSSLNLDCYVDWNTWMF